MTWLFANCDVMVIVVFFYTLDYGALELYFQPNQEGKGKVLIDLQMSQ